MPVASGTVRPAVAGIKATRTTVNIVTPGIAGTEFTHTFPANTKAFSMRVRGLANLQVADATGQTNITYWTIPKRVVYTENGLDLPSTTIFMECDKASQVVEIIQWS